MANSNAQQEKDLQKALELLGREPRTPFVVKTKCADGSPQVLLAEPVFMENGIWKPFPTFLWLVCPVLKLRAARLEQEGLIKLFSDKLLVDPEFRAAFELGQKQIGNLRLEMAKRILPGKLPEHIKKILSETTIAGSMDVSGVKCLHAHLAQELAFGNNPIGKEVLAKIGSCAESHERTGQ
ncbi:MAG: DUF501 domain-containing protein [Candidatus Rifleibacteriota bacterium]